MILKNSIMIPIIRERSGYRWFLTKEILKTCKERFNFFTNRKQWSFKISLRRQTLIIILRFGNILTLPKPLKNF